jgi:adenylate cyclase
VKISIRTGLSIGIVALVILTAVLVYAPWQVTSRDNIDMLDDRINALAIESVGSKIDGVLDDAVAARTAIGQNIEARATDIEDRGKAEALFVSVLEAEPNLGAIEFGWDDDRSLLVRRLPDGRVQSEYTTPSGDAAIRDRRVYEYDKGMKAPGQSKIDPSTYLVTQQFWYKTAFTQDAPVWSNIARLPSSGAFGVTNAQNLELGGDVEGALGVSIELNTLSHFLDGITVGHTGSVFLTNTAGQLVAAPHAVAQASTDANAPVALPRLDESALLPVRVVAGALKTQAIDLKALKGAIQLTQHDAISDADYFVTLAPLPQMGLVACVVLPTAEVLGPIERNAHMLMMGLSVFVVLVLIGSILVGRLLVGAPLAKVTANLRQLEDFRFDKIDAVRSIFTEVHDVSGATARMAASLSSFKKYIPTELVRTLFAQGIEAKLGGEMKDLTILFMDLAGFTAISERLGDRLIAFLGDYLSEMSGIIQTDRGTIDKYIGDAIMAFWGAPLPDTDHALNACRAALTCQARLAELRAGHPHEMGAMRARIGINTGHVLVGNIGSHDRINYSVIGDPVNVASRLESLNKAYGTAIMLGEDTHALVKDRVMVRRLDTVAVYGRMGGLAVYELLGLREEDTTTPAWIAQYEDGLTALRRRDWDGAITLFETVIATRGDDPPSALQIGRAGAYKAAPPPTDWDGLVVMDSK